MPKHIGDLLTSGVCVCVCVYIYIYFFVACKVDFIYINSNAANRCVELEVRAAERAARSARNLKLLVRFFTNEKRRYCLTET